MMVYCIKRVIILIVNYIRFGLKIILYLRLYYRMIVAKMRLNNDEVFMCLRAMKG